MGWQKIMLIWQRISSMKDKKTDLGRCGGVQENQELWRKGRQVPAGALGCCRVSLWKVYRGAVMTLLWGLESLV